MIAVYQCLEKLKKEYLDGESVRNVHYYSVPSLSIPTVNFPLDFCQFQFINLSMLTNWVFSIYEDWEVADAGGDPGVQRNHPFQKVRN